MNDAFNKALIQKHEGRELVAYRDSVRNDQYPEGILTIGDGFNLETGMSRRICEQVGIDYDAVCAGQPITDAQCDAIFELQYQQVASNARMTFPNIDSFPQNAAAVLCDLIYEIGYGGFLLFHQTILAAKSQNWPGVIAGIGNSKLASEVPTRVADNISLLEAIPS
jgi:GH24 family phage-related lysozyme (muramidase)